MSVASSVVSNFNKDKDTIFQDLPLVDKACRLTISELRNSDKQVVNELVYRWCRVLTRSTGNQLPDGTVSSIDTAIQELRKVFILDMMSSFNPIRLATVLKRNDRRMRLVGVVRTCKINSTFVTINSYLGRQANLPSSLKLIVIYHDEFFIIKTLELLKETLKGTKCHILLVLPRLDRQEEDVLNLISNYQRIRCDFVVSRKDIGPSLGGEPEDYEQSLNKIYFQRLGPGNKSLPTRIEGRLKEDGLHLDNNKVVSRSLNETIFPFTDK